MLLEDPPTGEKRPVPESSSFPSRSSWFPKIPPLTWLLFSAQQRHAIRAAFSVPVRHLRRVYPRTIVPSLRR